jgi:hypothetical protein
MLQPSGWQDEYAKLGKQLDELTGQWMEASKQESHEDS